ncbi:MAG: bifunctional proline dehydrogenase/L-glutamate gamma-semialdehyde dehydrogenase, partial [bacterium]|nr:bifunctional proline dehydrogenase/L-glutamate gamma-semialdehyde dehydrogenase [bacterium]
RAIRKNVTDMAERFIVGSDAMSAQKTLAHLHKQGIAFTVDLLGELTISEKEAEEYQRKYLDLIVNLAAEAKNWPNDDVIDRDNRGEIPRVNVSIKITALGTQLKAMDPKAAVQRLIKRILPLFLAAKKNNVFINVDLEQWAVHGITYDLFAEIVLHPELCKWPHLGIVVQAYLKDAHKDVTRLLDLARKRGAPLTVRLVKGAYWDYEVVNARQYGFDCPVFTEKSASDENYEKLTRTLMDNIEYLTPALGSHNMRSLVQALVYAKEKNIPNSAFEIQMLYGMAEPERRVLRARGYRVRVYAPIGDLLPGMAYLVRRLLENTSNSGFLRMSHHNDVNTKQLMQQPKVLETNVSLNKNAADKFTNCAFLDFTKSSNRDRFAFHVDKHQNNFPYKVPAVVSGKIIETDYQAKKFCPSAHDQLVGVVSYADTAECENAVAAATKYFPVWRDTSLNERCNLLNKLADKLENDRIELAALQTLEVGKPWAEADADVAEAIDFCRYYAERALVELSAKVQGNIWGEYNELMYQGRGVTTIIAPWNFPLAILCGMSVAALVSGNTVIMKPAEQSSVTAYFLFQRMLEVGFPVDAIQFLPGDGEIIGSYLVKHPSVAQIAFTGSQKVGLEIVKNAAVTSELQAQVKRVVCEMGGKNATIVDDDADLDEAILGVMHGAFGFAGQKCSATSRVIVVKSVYDVFVKRLIEACRSLHIASAHDPACSLGPVIDEESCNRLKAEIKMATEKSRPLFIGEFCFGGNFVPPALFEVDSVNHYLMQQEFFGPIVALMPVDNFDQAISVANSTKFALTGAVYSRSPSNIDKARQQFQVGNLYLNRASTGAMVYRQPFGGFKMSGIGTKAGGPNYLLNFTDMRCVTENTMRRGFTPELES